MTSCTTTKEKANKDVKEQSKDEVNKMTEENKPEVEVVNVVNESSSLDAGNKINAKLDCGNKTAVELLTISSKKYDVSNFKCKIRREKGLKIEFSDNSGLTFNFHLIGVEDLMIQKDVYPCKNENNKKYAVVTLNSKELGTHNFGDSFKGHVRITDYGMSSDVLCGTYKVIDAKGNTIEGTFYEMISSF
jgi:hypothetical protein